MVLMARMKEMGLEEAPYWWYLDLRKYGGNAPCRFSASASSGWSCTLRMPEHPGRASIPKDYGSSGVLRGKNLFSEFAYPISIRAGGGLPFLL